MAFRILMRGGIYILFIIGVVVSWLMKRNPKKYTPPDFIPTETAETDIHQALQSRDWRMRLWAVEELGKNQQPDNIRLLCRYLDDNDADVRETVATSLTVYGAEAVAAISTVLQHGTTNSREMAVKALALIRTDEALHHLAQAMLHDESAWIRIPAAQTLAAQNDAKWTEAFANLLKDNHKDVYQVAADALQLIGTADALAALVQYPYQPPPNSRSKDEPTELF
jgi:HEAT repeat protein